MLNIENLTVAFDSRRGRLTAVKGVSLSVERGEILGVVGESGAGKSTIGAAVMGLLESGGSVQGGEIEFEGQNLLELDDEAMRSLRGRKIGMIFQDPMTALNPVRTIGDQLSETIAHSLSLDVDASRKSALQWLHKMDIPNPETRIDHYPHEFSGGQRQRLVIALALCGEPDLVIADEPTTALDVSVQAQILQLIKRLVDETRIGIILITHNMGVVAEITDRVAIMRYGELVEVGPTKQTLQHPQTPYAQMLIASVPPADRRLARLPVPGPDGQLLPAQLHSAQPYDAKTLLRVENLSVTYRPGGGFFARGNPIHALKKVSFEIPKGGSLGLVGESGSGKSTCARAIVGLTHISQGEVWYDQHHLSAMGERERRPLRADIQMIFQDPYSSLNKRMRILDIVAEPLRFYGIANHPKEVQERVVHLLETVGLGADALKRYPHQFSGGQRQRIAVARTLASKPRLIICDEPTSALDVSVQAQVLNLIKDLQSEYELTLLFISHDLPVVRQMCDRIAVLKDGQVVEMSQANDIFENPQQDYTRLLIELMPKMAHVV